MSGKPTVAAERTTAAKAYVGILCTAIIGSAGVAGAPPWLVGLGVVASGVSVYFTPNKPK